MVVYFSLTHLCFKTEIRYGEVTYGGMERLYEALELRNEDVFYDLGCGVGKFLRYNSVSVIIGFPWLVG